MITVIPAITIRNGLLYQFSSIFKPATTEFIMFLMRWKTIKHIKSAKRKSTQPWQSLLIKAQDKNKSQKFVSEQLFKQ